MKLNFTLSTCFSRLRNDRMGNTRMGYPHRGISLEKFPVSAQPYGESSACLTVRWRYCARHPSRTKVINSQEPLVLLGAIDKVQKSNSAEHARTDTLCMFSPSSHFCFLFSTSTTINSTHIYSLSPTFLLSSYSSAWLCGAIMLIPICRELRPVTRLDRPWGLILNVK